MDPVWAFRTSVSSVKHEEWEMREIIAHIVLITDTTRLIGCWERDKGIPLHDGVLGRIFEFLVL